MVEAMAKAKWRQRQRTMAQPLTISWWEGRVEAMAKAKWRQRHKGKEAHQHKDAQKRRSGRSTHAQKRKGAKAQKP